VKPYFDGGGNEAQRLATTITMLKEEKIADKGSREKKEKRRRGGRLHLSAYR